jgi:hypothetical protein
LVIFLFMMRFPLRLCLKQNQETAYASLTAFHRTCLPGVDELAMNWL